MKGKTHEETHEMWEQMRRYKAEGHSNAEVAERFGVSKEHSKLICRGIASQSHRNQYQDEAKNIERVKAMVEEHCPGFEYAGNYTGTDGHADIRCKECGAIIHRTWWSIRHGKATCDACASQSRELKRINDKIQADRQKELARQKRERDRRLAQKYQQLSIKICPICGDPFVGRSTYCSNDCQRQNKWQMKEGYRHQFPLEDVFKRANGICYICGKPCDWNDYTERDGVIIYGDNYPSRDHVIPKSRGGANSWENIKLAHRICNSLKSTALPLVEKMT